MSIIPTPEQARELRTLFDGHPTIALALAWLSSAGVDQVHDAVDQLPRWPHYSEMSEREIAATYAMLVPPPPIVTYDEQPTATPTGSDALDAGEVAWWEAGPDVAHSSAGDGDANYLGGNA